jgi:ABC-type phosphate transport system substrate-binding protein
MRLAAYILCLLLIAGLSCVAADLSASTYHWNMSSAPVKKGAEVFPLDFPLEEPIVVVVNKSNPVDSLTLRQLARIYSGEVTEWPNGEPITVLNRPIFSDVRQRFYRFVLNAPPTQKFFQTGSPIPFETLRVDTEGSIARFAARDKSVIGYCYVSCANTSVKVLQIEGRSPGNEGYALK